MAELKPCPFCGGKGKIEAENWWSATGNSKYLALCENYDNGCWGMQENWFDTLEQAIEAWNRRAEYEKPL